MNEQAIKETLSAAVATLQNEEAAILAFDVGERTICACLAGILKRAFDRHSVHVEYNRHGVFPKEIELPDGAGELTDRRVFPDIIVHQPGHDDANLLVVEVKKTTNPVSDDLDIAKLRQIKRQIGYEFAVFLRLPTGPDADPADLRFIWI
ncbi:hypothetical protein [Novosphingobium mathurense]|uniref:PD-(D/E)XK nuclease superfamily protein n=1 Tax=Novosphingobium mathurense TaxID=428990 RepID=A0A1U6H620_9SPHN|nr:hypothetical protein [Novosphingobium mathurense]SLJ91208.1 hypothetical protein SAMN06295987_1011338 [Novosphingobium mathurense]